MTKVLRSAGRIQDRYLRLMSERINTSTYRKFLNGAVFSILTCEIITVTDQEYGKSPKDN